MIYANSFMNIIRKYTSEKQQLLGNEEVLGKESVRYSNDIRQICTNNISAKVLESNIDDMNVRYIFIILDLFMIILIRTDYIRYWIISLRIKITR